MSSQSGSKPLKPSVAMGTMCLALGLVLPINFHPSAGRALNVLHFVSGLLIGISLSVNLVALWKASRKRRSGSI